MTTGDFALTSLPQADGSTKIRPVLLLKRFPPFGDFLVCGVSSQLRQEVAGFDHVIDAGGAEFGGSGLKTSSVIRLGFLATLPESHLVGRLGAISSPTLNLLLKRLTDFLAGP